MIITVNGFALNSAGVYLDEDVVGLNIPTIRTSNSDFAGRAGGYIGSQLFGTRQLSFQGQIFASAQTSLYTMRSALQSALVSAATGSKFPVTINITTDDGRQWLINAYLINFDMPIKRAVSSAPYKIELIAPDPVIYDNSTSGSLTAILSRQTGGGLTWPLTWPLTWATGSGPTNVVNTGTTTVYPIITLTDIMTNPIITDTTTGKVFKLNPLTTSAGDVVVINMSPAARTVLLNGGNIAPFVTADSSWFGLIVGTNNLLLTTSSGSDTVTGTVQWKPGVMGI